MSEYESIFLFNIERSAVGILGLTSYGVHANGIVIPNMENAFSNSDLTTTTINVSNIQSIVNVNVPNFKSHLDQRRHTWKMWIAQRSLSKYTYPGLLDQIAAGGLSLNQTPHSALLKECWEEAGMHPQLTGTTAVPVGTISYHRSSHFAILPKIQFLYDLYLPESFSPSPVDGEVSKFSLWTMDEILKRILNDEFKPNCAMTIIDFCIRHGIIRSDNEQDYNKILAGLHRSLPYPFNQVYEVHAESGTN